MNLGIFVNWQFIPEPRGDLLIWKTDARNAACGRLTSKHVSSVARYGTPKAIKNVSCDHIDFLVIQSEYTRRSQEGHVASSISARTLIRRIRIAVKFLSKFGTWHAKS